MGRAKVAQDAQLHHLRHEAVSFCGTSLPRRNRAQRARFLRPSPRALRPFKLFRPAPVDSGVAGVWLVPRRRQLHRSLLVRRGADNTSRADGDGASDSWGESTGMLN